MEMVMVVAKLVMMPPAYDHDAPSQDLAVQGGIFCSGIWIEVFSRWDLQESGIALRSWPNLLETSIMEMAMRGFMLVAKMAYKTFVRCVCATFSRPVTQLSSKQHHFQMAPFNFQAGRTFFVFNLMMQSHMLDNPDVMGKKNLTKKKPDMYLLDIWMQ